ncbi:hypothetical protein H0H81_011778 [Sphagnurus paluster]|uniref:Uncharacterized protein n=1 Tax=Sphagnurus paluster TaxID=117069 RepID=A0A9P7GIC8_9AGAR|nr:hypothetical protein H0H81_011778 [Sphagnurus paluster]
MPNLGENNVHSVEFEAPLSSDNPPTSKRIFSIDLSLELERQLDMEAFPPTPAPLKDTQTDMSGANEDSSEDSMDPQVLAHIVKQLQQSLVEVTQDRDELQKAVALSHSHEAELQDALQHMIDKATSMEVQLSDARRKIKDDEEAIALLRTKVEESRRGLMRLQTESRRQSLAPVDLGRAGLPSFGSPQSSKRQSFTPLTGSFTTRPTHGHRRIASVSNSPTNATFFDKSPNAQTLTFPDADPSPRPPSSSRRYSGLFGPALEPDPSSPELDSLRKQLQSLKDELETTRHELSESNEAREASETCVKALREFINQNNIGSSNVEANSRLPPPPTMIRGDEGERKTASWGFKLWGDSGPKASLGLPQSATIASPPAVPSPQLPMSATPLSRKLGGFFGARSLSISSMASTPVPLLQSNATPSFRDSLYSTSDTSSFVEPASPPNEIDTHVVVRESTGLSDSSAEGSPDLGKEIPIRTYSRGIVT